MIHPKAHVDNATIGNGTKIWQFASVVRGAVLGENCVVGSGATIDGAICGDHCLFGANCGVFPGIVIGDDVFIGPGAILCNDRWPATSKDGFNLDNLGVTIEIKDGASIGANAVVLPGVVIGRRSVVAAGAVVPTNVPSAHVFMRDGTLLKIKPEWRTRRMRKAA